MVLRMKLVKELSRGKEGVESKYLVLDLTLASWRARWYHISQPPVNSTVLSGSLSWGLVMVYPLGPKFSLAIGQDLHPVVLPKSHLIHLGSRTWDPC